MPMYDYECKKCGRIFEAYHAYADDEEESCQHDGCDGKGARVQHTSQKLKRPYYTPPPKAQKKFGERGLSPHRPAKWR